MNLIAVKNLNWITVTDWSKLSTTKFDKLASPYVKQADIDSFVENLFCEIATKLNVPYSQLEPILKEKNSDFYSTKERLYKHYGCLALNDSGLFELQKLLKIPDISNIPDSEPQPPSNVSKIILEFLSLSNSEKREVLKQLEHFR